MNYPIPYFSPAANDGNEPNKSGCFGSGASLREDKCTSSGPSASSLEVWVV